MKKTVLIFILIMCLVFACCSFNGNQENNNVDTAAATDCFTEHCVKIKQSEIKYCLYTPKNAKEKLPLIVYLHGGSGKGNQLSSVYQDGLPEYLKSGKLEIDDAYVVIPQLPSDKKGWSDFASETEQLILYISETYKIDGSKISLTGHSMGGTGTWSLALTYPNLFSCIAPLSGSVRYSRENVNILGNLPVRAFVCSEDIVVDPESSRQMISALQKINAYAQITVFDGANHFDVPELAYLGNTGLIEWLIFQNN